MNREILFRGKREYGDWVIGQYIKACAHWHKRGIHEDWIVIRAIQNGGMINILGRFAVIPETVGQFTGLCDKNGTKIFEGDIVKIVGDSNNDDWKDVNYIAQIVFIDGGFCAIDGTTNNYSFRRYCLSRCEFDLEVVGNIHDNPKLLGE